MRLRFQPWQLALVLILTCAAAIFGLRWYRNYQTYDAAHLFALLPVDGATLFYADTGVLRESRILDLIAGSRTVEEPEYQKFIEQTGFDYRTDLDAVAAVFRGRDVYFALRGRFRWKQLSEYARLQGGTCQYTICTMPGSTPERNISFYPVTRDVLALAVSKEVRGVNAIVGRPVRPSSVLPAEPIWLSTPGETVRASNVLPASWKPLLGSLANANQLTVALGPAAEDFQLRMEIDCATKQAADGMTRDLTNVIQVIRRVAQQAGADDPDGVASAVLSGTFQQHDNRVAGTWPLRRQTMSSLFSSKSE